MKKIIFLKLHKFSTHWQFNKSGVEIFGNFFTMKILQVMTELGFGGAERVVWDLSRALTAQGHTVFLAVMKDLPEKNMKEDFKQIGIYPDILKINSFRDWKKSKKLRKLIREYQPDVIHSHLMHPNLIARIANYKTGIPLVNTIHISERRSGQSLFFLLDSLTHPLCSCYTAVSDASARFHEKKVHLKEGSIRTIRNGVDPAAVRTADELEEAKDRWQVRMCNKLLGAVGRLNPQKGFDRLLRVLSSLEQQVPQGETWGVVILGEGEERKNLEEQLSNCSHRNLVVRLPGFEKDAASYAQAFDAFVMPSRYEGYGLVLAEAISLGLPCVYAPVDSLPELAEGVPNAFPARFDRPDKDAETAEIIANALSMPRSEKRTLCSVGSMAAEYLALYEELGRKDGQK